MLKAKPALTVMRPLRAGIAAIRSQTGITTEWSYTGEQNDPSGLEFLRARYYDPANGRFASRDPLPLMQRYSYAGNNPATFIDPSGLISKKEALGTAAGFAAASAGGFGTLLAYTSKVILDSHCWLRGGCKAILAWQADVLKQGVQATWKAAVKYVGGAEVAALYAIGKIEAELARKLNNLAKNQCFVGITKVAFVAGVTSGAVAAVVVTGGAALGAGASLGTAATASGTVAIGEGALLAPQSTRLLTTFTGGWEDIYNGCF